MKEIEPIISELSDNLEIDLHSRRSLEDLKLALSEYINDLIVNDFHKLMRILYRVDVSEKMLRSNLQNQEQNAAGIIADMIVDRQLQKMKTRKQFRSDNDIAENEKW